MRYLVVGSQKSYALEQFYAEHLRSLGNTVQIFPIQDYFHDYYNKRLINKLLYRLGVSNIIKKLNNNLVEFEYYYNPHVILVFKGMEVLEKTLVRFKKKNIYLVNYNPDNPFFFGSIGSGNKNITNAINTYNLHLTYNEKVLEEFRKRNINTALIPFGSNISEEEFNHISRSKEVKKVCFLGTPDKTRIELIRHLSINGIQIDLYGNWPTFDSPNVQVFNEKFGLEYFETLRKYRVQLNLLREHNKHSHSMRSFEIPSVGGIQLTNNTIEHNKYFEANKDIFFFVDFNDCLIQCRNLLALSDSESSKIRSVSRSNFIVKNYHYSFKAKDINQIIKHNVNKHRII
jgi:spore maturation protein CgeB